MPRSKRRWAVSLHEVAKCTVPRRWSVSSCASAGAVKDAAVAAIAMADASLNMGTSLIGAIQPERWNGPYQDGPGPAISPPVVAVQLSLPRRSATARLSIAPRQKAAHDPPLHPTGNGRNLGATDALPDLVRDRGARGRRHGRAWDHPERGGQDHLG